MASVPQNDSLPAWWLADTLWTTWTPTTKLADLTGTPRSSWCPRLVKDTLNWTNSGLTPLRTYSTMYFWQQYVFFVCFVFLFFYIQDQQVWEFGKYIYLWQRNANRTVRNNRKLLAWISQHKGITWTVPLRSKNGFTLLIQEDSSVLKTKAGELQVFNPYSGSFPLEVVVDPLVDHVCHHMSQGAKKGVGHYHVISWGHLRHIVTGVWRAWERI